MGLIQKVRGLLGFLILAILFSLSAGAEEYHSGHIEETAPAADPEVVCQTYLVNVRNDMITQLERERSRLNGIATCFTSTVDESGTCAEQTAGVLDTLDAYKDYEANRFLSTVGFDSYRGDAAVSMRTNADFGVNNHNTATMGGFAPMTHMNPERFPGGFIGDHVERFQAAQRPHLANWWQSNITSERFPNWDQCVATDDSGQVQWDSRGDSALLYPQFLDNPGSGDRIEEADTPEVTETEVTETDEVSSPDDSDTDDLQMDCDSLRAFFANNPQAIDLTNQVALDSEQALLDAENLQPWHGFLDRLSIIDPDPRILDQVSAEELTRMEVARAHNRLATRFTDFQDHVAGWEEDELGQLLAFDQVRNSPATQQNCPGMEAPSGFQWSDLLLMIPGAGVVSASFDMRDNYTAFVVGANGEQTYWQNHGETSTDMAIGMAAAVPLAAAEVAAGRYLIGPGMELADPYVRPALDRAGELIAPARELSRGALNRVRNVFRRTPTPNAVGQMDDTARLATAGDVLGRELSDSERSAVLRAHYSGSGELGADGINPAGIDNYTPAQLRAKTAELRAAGFSTEETRALMESGVTGLSSQARHQAFRDAYLTGDLNGVNSFISFQTPEGGQLAGQILRVNPDGSLVVRTANASGEFVEATIPRNQLGTVRLSDTARLVYERGANSNVDIFRNAVLTGNIDPGQRYISFETPGVPGRYSGEVLDIDPQTQTVTIRTQTGETRRLTQDELVSARTSSTSRFNMMAGSGDSIEILSRSGNSYSGVADGIELYQGEEVLRLVQPDGSVQRLRLDRLDVGTISGRGPPGQASPRALAGQPPGPRVQAQPPQFTTGGNTDYFVRVPGAPITNQNYILNAGDSVTGFSRFWAEADRITPDSLTAATQEMHITSGLGPARNRPYSGATRPDGTPLQYGQFHGAEGIANGRPSDQYAQAVSDRFGLGPISTQGRLDLPGIPEQHQPFNLPGQHHYPGASAHDSYFASGANILDGLRSMPRGSDEAFNAISDYYQIMANARPFENINNSLFMNQTNYLLETYGFQPMSHGYLDHLAMRLSPEQFRRAFRLHMEGRLPLPDESIRGRL